MIVYRRKGEWPAAKSHHICHPNSLEVQGIAEHFLTVDVDLGGLQHADLHQASTINPTVVPRMNAGPMCATLKAERGREDGIIDGNRPLKVGQFGRVSPAANLPFKARVGASPSDAKLQPVSWRKIAVACVEKWRYLREPSRAGFLPSHGQFGSN